MCVYTYMYLEPHVDLARGHRLAGVVERAGDPERGVASLGRIAKGGG